MNISTLLEHLSTAQKDNLIRGILAYGYSDLKSEIDISTPRKGVNDYIAECVVELVKDAEKAINAIGEVNDASDISLDGAVHDAFSGRASDVNCGGPDEQVRTLIVEFGLTPRKVNEIIAEEAGED